MSHNFENIPLLKTNNVHIWSFTFETYDDIVQYHFHLLSEDEKERANRFRFYKDKQCYVVTRGVLRLLSAQYLNNNPKDIIFNYEAFGKPLYKEETNLKFNVSHSGNRALIGFVKNHPLGVDIEKIKNDFDIFEVAENYFSKSEIESLHNIPKEEQYKGFFRCWTRKEAFIKAKGSGLSFPLDTFSVSIDSDTDAILLRTEWDKNEKNNWKLESFIPAEGYMAALITDSSVKHIDYLDWEH